MRVPLDPEAAASPKIRIGFELYRRRDRSQPRLGTLVDVEGGPGYSTTDSRDYFLGLSRPLMDRRDLLLVDARGTGLSGALNCPAFRRTADVPRPDRRDPRVRGRRPGADAAARGRERAERRGVGGALPPGPFSPFTGTEWTSLPYEGATACLRWPGPRRADPPVDAGAPYPAVPTLVINGDLDNITASAGACVVASRFANSTFVETHNTVHVSALGDRDGCGAAVGAGAATGLCASASTARASRATCPSTARPRGACAPARSAPA